MARTRRPIDDLTERPIATFLTGEEGGVEVIEVEPSSDRFQNEWKKVQFNQNYLMSQVTLQCPK
ncbi:MAG: hypothetical protein DCF25_18740 [Leptolyngbya foveolarum]|uniref:Uncharacterized protein n=1 Tax=Leptolyngbya foveolarum TaxID=47253 RepID=A0A2W4TSS2_9CYAN|nr:MAG: hypothetical protein DCF25_18740 [Leptolyngbya foveolarum]